MPTTNEYTPEALAHFDDEVREYTRNLELKKRGKCGTKRNQRLRPRRVSENGAWKMAKMMEDAAEGARWRWIEIVK